jgi:hypothetical protein
VRPASVDATSAELLGAVYRTTGTTGALGLFARRRVVVVLFFVCASAIVGAAPQTVSATSMAIWILRENIYPFFNCELNCQMDCSMARKVPSAVRDRRRICGRPIAWNIPVRRVFSPEATGIQPHQEYEWLSGIITFCAKA